MNQLSLQKFCSLATLARQNRNNTAFNNHVPDMEQWTQVYIPYFPYKREVIFFACSLRSLAKIEITPLLIITSLTWNNEPKFIYHIFPIKEKWFFLLATLARQNRNNTAFNNHVPDMEQWTQVYIPYFPYKREVIFFACSLRSLAKIEITPLLIITSLTWNNEPKFIYHIFPIKEKWFFFARYARSPK